MHDRDTRRRLGAGLILLLLAATAGRVHALGDVMIAWSRNGSNTPYFATWDYVTGAWGAAAAMSSVGDEPNWVLLKNCPTRDEKIAVTLDGDLDVNVQVYDGCTWAAATEVCTDAEYTAAQRPVSVAYEQLSGDALVYYWDKSASDMGYVTWDGTTLAAEVNTAEPGGTKPRWVTLYPRPGTDDIIAVTHDDGKKTHAIVWDGSAWEGSSTEMGSNGKKKEYESCALAYESLSGDAVLVYEENNNTLRYQTWNGTTWSGESNVDNIGDNAFWVRMASDPVSDEIICVALDESHDINVVVWNGTSWGSALEIENDADPRDERHVDVAYEHGGNEALVVYYEKNEHVLRYRTWNGTVWSAEQLGTDILSDAQFIQLHTGCCRPGEIFIAIADDSEDTELLRWDGTTMSAKTKIESDTGGLDLTEPHMLTVPKLPSIVTWSEVSR